ncbi:hypothetical protein ACQ86L_0835 (plasmid) [Leifsonia sp. P73]|uniref:hypothetical protein n=1 Tax=unclassified Leifsonia TaxID=2663824 RepID=UPI003704C475
MTATAPAASGGFPWLDFFGVIFSGTAALGGVVAVIIAIRALTVARESTAVEQLFGASGDVLAALQEVSRVGSKLGLTPEGEMRTRSEIDDSFQRFMAARARVDLALGALGLRGDYSESVLNVVHNFAVSVRQADEFDGLHRDFATDDLTDQSWADELSWSPSGPDRVVLAQSSSFREVRFARELIGAGVTQLRGLDKWWGDRITEDHSYGNERSVYSIDASYLTQTSRLVDDFTREYVQPLFESAVRRVARSSRRLSPLT